MHHAPVVDEHDRSRVELDPAFALLPLDDVAQLGYGGVELADGVRCRCRRQRGPVVVVVSDGGQRSGHGLSRQHVAETEHVLACLQVLVVDGRLAQQPEVAWTLRAQLLGRVEAVD